MKHIFLLIGLFFTLLQGTQAQNFIYYETVKSGNWSDASTWKGGQIPTSGNIIYSSGHNKYITVKKGHKILSDRPITINTGSTLKIEGTLEVMGALRIFQKSTLIVTGRLLVHGNLELSGSSVFGTQSTGATSKGAYVGVVGNITTSGGNTINNKGVIRYGGFTMGGGINGDIRHSDDPLPIELKSFVASASQGVVRFVWVTASEKNNDYFTIEQSSDLKNWETIHRQQGAGNSFSELSYKAEKKLKGIGIFYFRLKQTDYDGQFSYSKIVSLSNNTLNEELPSAFSENGEIVIRNTYEHLQVFNIQGRLLGTYSQTYRLNDLPKGILIFVFDKQHKQKIVNY